MLNTHPENLDVWVLAGQSNMQGCGYLEGAPAPDERVWLFTMAGNWEIAEEPTHRLWESFTPVHKDFMRPALTEDLIGLSDEEIAAKGRREAVVGVSPGVAFGKTMAEATGKPVGLIAAAHGGTSLDQWSPGLKSQGGSSLYGSMLERIKRAGGSLRGILWYQGESDADESLSSTYAARLDRLIVEVRKDTGKADLPVIVVQIGRVIGWPEDACMPWNQVRKALYELPDRVPHTAATTAVDLSLADLIHVDTPSQIRLGKRLARAALSLTGQADIPAGPRVTGVERLESPPTLRVRCCGVVGGWLPQSNIWGFGLLDADGKLRADGQPFNAKRDPMDPASILVMFPGLPEGELTLGYGQGFNPYCNAVDEADMPLCSFEWKVG